MPYLILLLRCLSVVALCARVTPAPAQKPGAISLTQVPPASLRLRLENATAVAGRVQVVRLRSGQTLFYESYSGPAYGHRFDFDHVPSGRYLVYVQADGQMHRCLVRVETRNQVASIQRIKLICGPMLTSVGVKSRRSASGNGAVASVASLSPATLSQRLQGDSLNQ
jgi:hypothetical protein